MKLKLVLFATALSLFAGAAQAQLLKTPKKVKNVTVQDLNGNPATLPMWGKKNLMIFYVDPDKHKQNQEFTEEMEANGRAAGEGIYGFGIINLADAPLVPNKIARQIAAKRTEKNGATVLADTDHTLSKEWDLGDCNNVFVLLLVTKEGELVYMHKGELSKAEQEEFYKIVDKYRH